MSQAKKQFVSFCADIENTFRCDALRRNSSYLSLKDQESYRDLLGILSLVWYDLIPGTPTARKRDILQWCKTISNIDPRSLLGFFDVLSDALFITLRGDYRWNSTHAFFKQKLKESGCTVSGAILAPLRELCDLWDHSSSVDHFKSLRQAFTFAKRFTIYDDVALQDKCLAEFERYENEELQDPLDPLDLSWFFTLTFPSNDRRIYDNWFPKFGPGAVADSHLRLYPHEKYNLIGSDCRTRILDQRIGYLSPTGDRPFDRCSRVIAVPKSWNKFRIICAEPTTLSWYQQGFFSSIQSIINAPRVSDVCSRWRINGSYHRLHDRIRLDDQSQNRNLARIGSIDGHLSTIDLSNASDSVRNSLVKRWTRRSSLYMPLQACRSLECVLPDGRRITTKKLAPMGSALCFPCECLVFSGICESVIREADGEDGVSNSSYSVYGDDIIIETKYVQGVIDALMRTGFSVNCEKSFTSTYATHVHLFRESCGGEYLDGVDVTPIRISRRFKGLSLVSGGRIDVQSLNASVDLANRCFGRLPSVRKYIISILDDSLPADLRVWRTDDKTNTQLLWSPEPTNFQTSRTRPNPDLQVLEGRHGTVKYRTVQRGCDELKYLEALRKIARRKNLEIDSSPSVDRERTGYWAGVWDPLT